MSEQWRGTGERWVKEEGEGARRGQGSMKTRRESGWRKRGRVARGLGRTERDGGARRVAWEGPPVWVGSRRPYRFGLFFILNL